MRTPVKSLKNLAWAFWKDESGQSTTEYVLLLLFVVIAVKSVGTTMKDKLKGLIDTAFGKATSAVEQAETQ